MRKNNFLSVLCVMVLMSMVAVHADAQDLKSILTGVAKAVVGDKATTESSIIGTWKYVGPQCQFESENLLAKAGGEVAAKEVEEKMQIVYDKVGMNGCQYTLMKMALTHIPLRSVLQAALTHSIMKQRPLQ